jgi:hypothetical protein
VSAASSISLFSRFPSAAALSRSTLLSRKERNCRNYGRWPSKPDKPTWTHFHRAPPGVSPVMVGHPFLPRPVSTRSCETFLLHVHDTSPARSPRSAELGGARYFRLRDGKQIEPSSHLIIVRLCFLPLPPP